MDQVAFIEWDELLAIHRDQLEKYGGQDGFIDEGVVKSALFRPQFIAQYEAEADLADMAAGYLYALTTTQGFSDGNKRTGAVAAEYFLNKNGWETRFHPKLMYAISMMVARTEIDEEALAEFIRYALIEVTD